MLLLSVQLLLDGKRAKHGWLLSINIASGEDTKK